MCAQLNWGRAAKLLAWQVRRGPGHWSWLHWLWAAPPGTVQRSRGQANLAETLPRAAPCCSLARLRATISCHCSPAVPSRPLCPRPPVPPQATFFALAATYGFLTPELWRETVFTKSPMQEYSDFLAKPVGARPTSLHSDCSILVGAQRSEGQQQPVAAGAGACSGAALAQPLSGCAVRKPPLPRCFSMEDLLCRHVTVSTPTPRSPLYWFGAGGGQGLLSGWRRIGSSMRRCWRALPLTAAPPACSPRLQPAPPPT